MRQAASGGTRAGTFVPRSVPMPETMVMPAAMGVAAPAVRHRATSSAASPVRHGEPALGKAVILASMGAVVVVEVPAAMRAATVFSCLGVIRATPAAAVAREGVAAVLVGGGRRGAGPFKEVPGRPTERLNRGAAFSGAAGMG